jgi:ligand-binding SRPBCC domain-containing protein
VVVVEVRTRVAAPPARVFDLKLDMDVHAASQARSGETATTSGATPGLRLGEEVTLRARHFGIRWTLVSRVTSYERPRRFVDEQVRGPFAAMSHEHTFVEVDGGTLMTDRMRIRAPLGRLGRLADAAVLRPYLRRLLRQRADFVRTAAEAGGGRGDPAG